MNKQKIQLIGRRRHGFTIVELLVVIGVIAILATITMVAYNGIQGRAAETALQSDLKNGATKLELDNATNGRYPASVEQGEGGADEGRGLKRTDGTHFEYTYTLADNSYCLTATSDRSGVPAYMVSSSEPTVQQGVCSGHSGPSGTGDEGGEASVGLQAELEQFWSSAKSAGAAQLGSATFSANAWLNNHANPSLELYDTANRIPLVAVPNWSQDGNGISSLSFAAIDSSGQLFSVDEAGESQVQPGDVWAIANIQALDDPYGDDADLSADPTTTPLTRQGECSATWASAYDRQSGNWKVIYMGYPC